MVHKLKAFWANEQGIGTLEIIIIIAILVLVAFAFREWILQWVSDLFTQTDNTITNIDEDLPPGLYP
mgnify:FL=1